MSEVGLLTSDPPVKRLRDPRHIHAPAIHGKIVQVSKSCEHEVNRPNHHLAATPIPSRISSTVAIPTSSSSSVL